MAIAAVGTHLATNTVGEDSAKIKNLRRSSSY